MGFELTGEGEHTWLSIRKRGLNTSQVVRHLSEFSGVPRRDIGFSGMKDRHAVTTQWFSLCMTGLADRDWSDFEAEGIELLQVCRHSRKLRRGTHRKNLFRIRVTELQGDMAGLEQRLRMIGKHGVPNYFAEQRFGRDNNNLKKAADMFAGDIRVKDRALRGIYLSAARSMLFNQVLSARVAGRCWDSCISGDVMMLDGTHSTFATEDCDEEMRDRLQGFDIHPTGPLWGRGLNPVLAACLELETTVLADRQPWLTGLEQAGLKQERRALRLPVQDLEWHTGDGELLLSFSLPRGSFATSVVRELSRVTAATVVDGR